MSSSQRWSRYTCLYFSCQVQKLLTLHVKQTYEDWTVGKKRQSGWGPQTWGTTQQWGPWIVFFDSFIPDLQEETGNLKCQWAQTMNKQTKPNMITKAYSLLLKDRQGKGSPERWRPFSYQLLCFSRTPWKRCSTATGFSKAMGEPRLPP